MSGLKIVMTDCAMTLTNFIKNGNFEHAFDGVGDTSHGKVI